MANVLLRCADERLNDIIHKKFGDALTLAELGGVKWHLARDTMEELFEQIEFAIDHKETKAVDLVSHTDCGLYKELGEDEAERYQEDLTDAVGQLEGRFPDLKVTGYLFDTGAKELNRIEP